MRKSTSQMRKLKKVLGLLVFVASIAIMTYIPLNNLFNSANNSFLDRKNYIASTYSASSRDDLVNAINNSSSGDIINLTGNIDSASSIEIPSGKNVTINLNNYNISTSLENTGRHYYAFINRGTVYINGNGTISARGVANFGEMHITNATVEAQDQSGAGLWNEGTLYVSGGTVSTTFIGTKDDSYGVVGIYNLGTLELGSTTVTSVNKRSYAVVSVGTMTIDGAIVHGTRGAVAVDGGSATIEDGTFTGDDFFGLYVSNDGAKTNAAGTITQTATTATVIVNDGTFTGKIYSVYLGSDLNNTDNSTATINGGTYQGGVEVSTDTGSISIDASDLSYSSTYTSCTTVQCALDELNSRFN